MTKLKYDNTPRPRLKKAGRKRIYHFGDLDIGHVEQEPYEIGIIDTTKKTSLFIRGKSASDISSSIRNFCKVYPEKKFICLKVKGGVRVWEAQ